MFPSLPSHRSLDVNGLEQVKQVAHFLWNTLLFEATFSAWNTFPSHFGQAFWPSSSDLILVKVIYYGVLTFDKKTGANYFLNGNHIWPTLFRKGYFFSSWNKENLLLKLSLVNNGWWHQFTLHLFWFSSWCSSALLSMSSMAGIWP